MIVRWDLNLGTVEVLQRSGGPITVNGLSIPDSVWTVIPKESEMLTDFGKSKLMDAHFHLSELRQLATQLAQEPDWRHPMDPRQRELQRQAYKERANPSAILQLFRRIDALERELRDARAVPIPEEKVITRSDVRKTALEKLDAQLKMTYPNADVLRSLAGVVESLG